MTDNTLQTSQASDRNPVYPYHFGCYLAFDPLASPTCPVCQQPVPPGGCIHMADEALATWQARRG